MVVTKKQAAAQNPTVAGLAAPPAPSRTPSTTSTPKAAKKASIRGSTIGTPTVQAQDLPTIDKGKEPAQPSRITASVSVGEKTEPLGAAFSEEVKFLPSPPKKSTQVVKPVKKAKSKPPRAHRKHKKETSFLDIINALTRLLIVAFTFYSFIVCPKDTNLESPVCRSLVNYRERILEPYVYPPLRAVVSHPSVAPHIERARPYVDQAISFVSLQYNLLYKKFDFATRPYVSAIQLRLRPHMKLMEYNYRRYRRQAQPYVDRATSTALEAWFKAAPYLQPVLIRIQSLPALANEFVTQPLVDAKQKWVDPQIEKMVLKVEELSASANSGHAKTTEHVTFFSTVAPPQATQSVVAEPEVVSIEDAPPKSAPSTPPVYVGTSDNVYQEVEDDPEFFKDFEEWVSSSLMTESETSTEPAPPKATDMTPEEKAEFERALKEHTAEKRADLQKRHTEWEAQLSQLRLDGIEEYIKSLTQSRLDAMKDLTDSGGAWTLITEMEEELKDGISKTKTFLEKTFEKRDENGVVSPERISTWNKVVEKVELKFGERVRGLDKDVSDWVRDWMASETDLTSTARQGFIGLAEKAQVDLLMGYAWLKDVTYHDWDRYHRLMDVAKEGEKEIETLFVGAHSKSPANDVNGELEKITKRIAEISDSFREDLVKLKIEARKLLGSEASAPVRPKDPRTPEGGNLPDLGTNEYGIPVFDGGVGSDPFIGKAKEQVQEAVHQAEAAKVAEQQQEQHGAHDEL